MVSATVGKESYQTRLVATGHDLIADEPLEVGGSDLGPSPGQFLQMSLAACTAITLRMYANRHHWPLDGVRVEVGTEKSEKETLFLRQIYLTGLLTEDQKARLLEIAEACPVHRTLTRPIRIESQLK